MILVYLKKILIQSIKYDSKPKYSSTVIKKSWSSKSKAFSVSMVIRYGLTLQFSDASRISQLSLLDSPITLFATYAVCSEDIRSGSMSFKAYDIIS